MRREDTERELRLLREGLRRVERLELSDLGRRRGRRSSESGGDVARKIEANVVVAR